MSSGIYKITIGRWFYYGQTNNFTKRKNEHIRKLKQGKHENVLLQRAFNKHNLFEFEECAYENNTDLLTELEQLVIDEWFGKPNCANLNPEASVPPSRKGHKHSEETKARMSVVQLGQKRKPRSEEHKANLSAALKGKPVKPHSEETKAKLSASHKGHKHSEETKAKISAGRKLYHERKRQENVNG